MSSLVSKTLAITKIIQLINLVAKFASTSTETDLGRCFTCVKLKCKRFDYVNV